MSKERRASFLGWVERALGSSFLSWICICLALVSMDVGLWVGFLILIPLANYTVMLEEIHARATGADTPNPLPNPDNQMPGGRVK